MTTLRERLQRQAGEAVAAYQSQDDVDLPGLASSLTVFAATAVTVGAGLRAGGHQLPERYSAHDLVVGGVAVHKLSRLVTKASVTSPLRAPFTEFEGPSAPGEHRESPRGEHGVRHTVGELLTCPFCLGVWAAGAYVTGLVAAPRPTRAWAAVLATTAVSDFLQHAYARVQD